MSAITSRLLSGESSSSCLRVMCMPALLSARLCKSWKSISGVGVLSMGEGVCLLITPNASLMKAVMYRHSTMTWCFVCSGLSNRNALILRITSALGDRWCVVVRLLIM